MLKKLTHWKKKKFTWKVQFVHCSHAPLFNEQWSMPPLFTEQWTHASTVQCTVEAWYTVQWTLYHATLFTEQCTNLWIESRARKQYFSAFHLLAFYTQFMVGPCTVNHFFFVNKTFASCVFDKTQALTRSQTYSLSPRNHKLARRKHYDLLMYIFLFYDQT